MKSWRDDCGSETRTQTIFACRTPLIAFMSKDTSWVLLAELRAEVPMVTVLALLGKLPEAVTKVTV